MLSRIIVWAVIAAGCLAGAEHRGTVMSSRLPIPGAVVSAQIGDRKVVTSTDESGVYVIEDLPEGEWTIQVEAFGFEKVSRTVAGAGGEAASWELKMAPRAAAPVRPDAARRQAAAALFQRLGVNQTVQNEAIAALAAPMPEVQFSELNQNANESFLVSGSLSRGLQEPREEGAFGPGMMLMGMMGGAGMGAPGMGAPAEGAQGAAAFGGGAPGASPEGAAGVRGPGGIAGPGIRGPGGFGGGMGRPGLGGGPGMRGGPGREGAAGAGRGRPGEGVPGGRPQWQGRAGTMLFGNRANRVQPIRGALFFNLRNSALDARPYSLTGQTVEKPSYAQSRFGLMAGGQLRIPKVFTSERTFFFVNYMGTRSRNPFNAVATLPSAAERLGDFSQSLGPGPVTVFDPLTRLPFAANRIPASRIDPAAAGLLSFFPMPNQTGRVQNYQFVTSAPQNTHNFGLRMFHSFSRQNRVGGSFNLQARDSENAQLYQFRDTLNGRGFSADLSWTRTIRTGFINNLRFNFSRNRSETIPYFAFGRNVAAELGIQGTSRDPLNYGPPNLSFTNFGDLADGSPSLRRDQTVGITEGITLVRGPHTFTTGVDYRRRQLNNRTDQNGRGTFVFSGIGTSGFDSAGQPLAASGFDFADFLLGLPQSSSIRFGSSDTYFRGPQFNAFFQDEWRVRSNLTLNLGLRYEFVAPLTEKYNRMANLDIAPGFTAVAPVTAGAEGPYTGGFPASLIQPDRNNLAPRLGFAWKPAPKRQMLVRGGYGIYYNASVYNQAASRLAQQPPFASSTVVNSSLLRTLTLRDGFGAAATTSITNSFAVDRFYRLGYAQTWNLAVQHDLPRSLVMEIGYLGTKGTRLDIQRLPNRAAPGSPQTAEQRRRIGNAVGFTFDSSDGNSIYHAGQFRLSRRFRRGVAANALYTYGKSIDNASTFGGGVGVVAQDDRNLSAERGLSSFDARHTLNLSYVLTSPIGQGTGTFGESGLAASLLKDWTLSGGLTIRSGSPFTAMLLGNRSDSGGTGVVGSARADATGQPVSLAGYLFNPAAFKLPAAGAYGNAARNTIPGPTSMILNMSLGRSIQLGESRRSVELRMESNNILNEVNVTRLGTTVNASNYGLPLSTGAMRSMQASLRFRF